MDALEKGAVKLALRLRTMAAASFTTVSQASLLIEAAHCIETIEDALEENRYANLEHEHLGCHVAKTGIYVEREYYFDADGNKVPLEFKP